MLEGEVGYVVCRRFGHYCTADPLMEGPGVLEIEKRAPHLRCMLGDGRGEGADAGTVTFIVVRHTAVLLFSFSPIPGGHARGLKKNLVSTDMAR